MNAKFSALALTLALTGCATTTTHFGGGSDLGTIAVNALEAHIRADRAAAREVAALIAGAVGYQRGKVMAGRTAEREAAALRYESGFDPSLTMQSGSYFDERGRTVDGPSLQSIEIEVGQAEMLTPDGTLHPRAARALARMDNMAREHGGDFSVSVPRSQIHTVAAIKAVVPGATILETDADGYRLIVVATER
jgi:hypothetical protein